MADFVIVGAGIYGAGTAWELAREGHDVVVLEETGTIEGASVGIGQRGVRANGRDVRELPLMDLAYDLWPKLSDEIDSRTGHSRIGHLRLIETETDGLRGGLGAARVRKTIQERYGIPTQLLDADEVRELEPAISTDVIGALYCPMDGVVNHTETTLGIVEAAKEEGVSFQFGTSATEIEVKNDTVTGVETKDGEHIPVEKKLVLLANAGVPELVESAFGFRLPIWEVFPQVVTTKSLDSVPLNHLIGHDQRRLAMKEISHDRVMISGGWSGERNPRTGKGEEVLERVGNNVEAAAAVYPKLEDVQLEDADASTVETATIDAIPIIDSPPQVSNAIFATGWTGHGYAIAPAVSRKLAEWAESGSKPALLRPFSMDRFTA